VCAHSVCVLYVCICVCVRVCVYMSRCMCVGVGVGVCMKFVYIMYVCVNNFDFMVDITKLKLSSHLLSIERIRLGI